MTAPSATARGTPAGIRMDEGLSTKVTFSRSTTFGAVEVEVTPPEVNGGDKIDTSTMHNTLWKTAAPQALQELGDTQFSGSYDPNGYAQAKDTLINESQVETVTFPDGSTLAFYGFVNQFTPQAHAIGDRPMCQVNTCATNWDPAAKVEAGPVYVNVSGS